jgi:hypothetical protein
VAEITMEFVSKINSMWRFVVFMAKLAWNFANFQNTKTKNVTAKSRPIIRWNEPKSSKEKFGESTRIIWGFWDKGESNMPGICELSVLSWKAKNPKWTVIILSDENFKEYVSVSDLPTTFASLKVQHRSDLIRVAVLRRYGGAYVDLPIVVYKGFDKIWDENPNVVAFQDLMMTSGKMSGNNCIILSPAKNNLFLGEFQKRMIKYCENPCTTNEEMSKHEFFSRLPHLKWLKNLGPYAAILCILDDMLNYDETTRCCGEVFRLSPENGWETFTRDFSISHFSWLVKCAYFYEWPNEDRAFALQSLKNTISVKYSTNMIVDLHQSLQSRLFSKTVMGERYRIAVDRTMPIEQASLDGSTPYRRN